MLRVMNFKERRIGNMLGVFDLMYHGLAVRGCRLVTGTNSYWFSFPQKEYNDEHGEKHYFDILYLTRPEHEHVSNLIILELQAQGFINEQDQEHQNPRKRDVQPMHSSAVTRGLPLEQIVADDDIPWPI